MGWGWATLRDRCDVFVYDPHKCVHHGKDTSLEDNSPKGLGLICSAVGKLQTPPQMKRKEWIWALITDDRVCCLSALWSQLINIRAGTKCNQKLNRPIPLQLKSPAILKADSDREREREKRYSEKAQQGKRDIWLLTGDTKMCILTETRTHTRTHHNVESLLSSHLKCNHSYSVLRWSFKIQLGNNECKTSIINEKTICWYCHKYSFIHMALLHSIS